LLERCVIRPASGRVRALGVYRGFLRATLSLCVILLLIFPLAPAAPSKPYEVSEIGAVEAALAGESSLTLVTVGNRTYLHLGEGLNVELDERYAGLVGESRVFADEDLRVIPVPLILTLPPGLSPREVAGVIGELGGAVNLTYTALPFVAVTVPAGNVARIRALLNGVSLAIDARVETLLNESVSLVKDPRKWSSLEEAVGRRINGSGVRIAVLDTGIYEEHPDFFFPNGTRKIRFSVSVVPGESPHDYHGHGTHVAGIAAGTGRASRYKFVGVAPGAILYNIKVLNRRGVGQLSWVIAGIEFAVNRSAHIINLSLGASENTNGTDPMSRAVDWAVERGLVAVVAAGNAGPGRFTVGIPAVARRAITVGATDKRDILARFSSQGPSYDFRIKPEVVAPGVDIIAAASPNSTIWRYLRERAPQRIVGDYYMLSGTSMSTPHVAGLAALLLDLHPAWTPEIVKSAIMNSALDLRYGHMEQGAGRVRAYEAATTPAVTLPAVLNFGFTLAGTYTLHATLTNLVNVGVRLTGVEVRTWSVRDRALNAYVSTNLTDAELRVGERIVAELMLRLPRGATLDFYEGDLRLIVGGFPLRAVFSFTYVTLTYLEAAWRDLPMEAVFFLYNLRNSSEYYLFPWKAPRRRLIGIEGTYVIHAMGIPVRVLRDGRWEEVVGSAFLLTEVFEVRAGELNRAVLRLEGAREFFVIGKSLDGRDFGPVHLDILSLYYEGVSATVVGRGPGVRRLYLSDTFGTIYFCKLAYVPGPRVDEDSLSDTSYSLSWVLHGVNWTTPRTLSHDHRRLARYELRYETNGLLENLETALYVSPPDPTGIATRRGFGMWLPVYPGTVRNYYIQYADWNWEDYYKREWHYVAYQRVGGRPFMEVVEFDAKRDPDKPIRLLRPPYFPELEVLNFPRITFVRDRLITRREPESVLGLEEHRFRVFRDGVEIPHVRAWRRIEFDSSPPGEYVIRVERKSGFLVWDAIKAVARFRKPSADTEPPVLTSLCAPAALSSPYVVRFGARDNVEVSAATLHYALDEQAWAPAELRRDGNTFVAEIYVPEGASSLSIRIRILDRQDNYVEHTVIPVARRVSPLGIQAPAEVLINPGATTEISASLTKTLPPVACQVFENGTFRGNFPFIRGKLHGYRYEAPPSVGLTGVEIRLAFSPLIEEAEARIRVYKTKVVIGEAKVSDERANVGTVQTVSLRAFWAHNISSVRGGFIRVNGTVCEIGPDGWAILRAQRDTVGRLRFHVDGASAFGVTAFEQRVFPSIVWDRIKIVEGGVADGRIDCGAEGVVWFRAVYEYDSLPLSGAKGALYVNGTAMVWSEERNRWEAAFTYHEVAKYVFTVSAVRDLVHGLTVINDVAGRQSIIWDRLEVYGFGRSAERANVGKQQTLWWQLRYDYDDVIFYEAKGSVTIGGVRAKWDPLGARWVATVTLPNTPGLNLYKMEFSDRVHGLTAVVGVTSQEIVSDRIVVRFKGVDDERRNVGTVGEVRFRLRSEYDGAPVRSGSVSINGILATWDAENGWWRITALSLSVVRHTYVVTNVYWDVYGITALNPGIPENSTEIVWDRIQVKEYRVSDPRTDVGRAERVKVRLVLEYDGMPLGPRDSVRINDVEALYDPGEGIFYVEHAKPHTGVVTFRVSSAVQTGYGITVLHDPLPPPSIVWDRVLIELRALRERVDVGSRAPIEVKAVYAYDSSPFVGDVHLSENLVQQMVGRYVYRAIGVLDRLHGLTVFASNTIDVVFDRVVVVLRSELDRVRVGREARITYAAHYEFDGRPLVGRVRLNRDLRGVELGPARFEAAGVEDEQFGLTAFTTNAVTVIFDEILASLEVESVAPFSVRIVLRLAYEYDGSPVVDAVVRILGVVLEHEGGGVYAATIETLSLYLESEVVYEVEGFEPKVLRAEHVPLGNILLWVAVAGLAVYCARRIFRRKFLRRGT